MSSLLAARQNILRSGRGATVPLHDIVLTSDQLTVDFDNLIGNADSEYILRGWVESASATLFPSIVINDDNAGTSYNTLYETTIAASVTPSESLNKNEYNLTPSLLISTDGQVFFEIKIKGSSGAVEGHVMEGTISGVDGVTGLATVDSTSVWTPTDEVNKITVRSGAPFLTSEFKAGSRFQLFTF